MSLPHELTGGWVRNGIAFDGGPAVEDTVVWWLQADTRYCDLRIPQARYGKAMSFAGTTTWADPWLTWRHELDLDLTEDDDRGSVTWDGADLMEAGTFSDPPDVVAYVERWQRLPGSTDVLLALSCPDGRIVRTGSYALTILDRRESGGEFAAVAWMLSEDGWSVHHRWPENASAPPPPAVVNAADRTVWLEDGSEWAVLECRVPDVSSDPARVRVP